MTDVTHAHSESSAKASGGWSGERIFIWLLLLAAFGFWVPYMFMIDHGVFTGHY